MADASTAWLPETAAYLAPEQEAVAALLPRAQFDRDAAGRVGERARRLIERLRQPPHGDSAWNALLHEYNLSSAEGVLLMSLAEALLRIPDEATARALLRDKLAAGDWARHWRRDGSPLTNAATWGLILGGRLYAVRPREGTEGSWYEGLATRLGEPVLRHAIERAMALMADHFVIGRNIAQAVARAAPPWRYSFDMLGEAALTRQDARRYFDAYAEAIAVLGQGAAASAALHERPGVSVKLSALHPRYEASQRERVRVELLPRLIELARLAREAGIGLTLDAEETERLTLGLELFHDACHDAGLCGFEGLGLAVQAYQKRALAVVEWVIRLARDLGRSIPLRLVKGAYWDSEIKRAQQLGLRDYPVFTRKAHTDASYLACARTMLAAPDALYSMFGTHNACTVAALLELAGPSGDGRRHCEFQRLHGMGEALYRPLLAEAGVPCRVYAPVGHHRELLPYLVRRLLENGANASFVNRVADTDVAVDELVADPIAAARAGGGEPHPQIPLPGELYRRNGDGGWRNSFGMSPADAREMGRLSANLRHAAESAWRAQPLVGGEPRAGISRASFDPADRTRRIGEVVDADDNVLDEALSRAAAGAARWDATPAAERARLLEQAADLIEGSRDALVALLAREAGRTRMNAIAEVREAADFCRYYAWLARRQFGEAALLPGVSGERNELRLHGHGVFACISPWNFPLSIFVGQIAAALAAGNAVLAKPAEQTPLVACAAARLLLQAGIPGDVLALLPGPGETVGAALVRDPRVGGVALTGSVGTARQIHQALAARDEIVPLIAETGGLNCMIVDSSALPEQVAADALQSAFDSAGQRCSALRVLFLQEEIAARALDLLCGAMDELVIGDPLEHATDIGPLIDADALQSLERHLARMGSDASVLHRARLPPECARGYYFAPALVEISRLDMLQGEVFGPILHVVRYRAAELETVIDAINRTRYGLTLGIQSRIDATWRRIQTAVHVGNCYVNRNMIGAVVGSQPFGGEGLSGTGPKAGGSHYLLRFARERVVTVNTAASGGNAALLAGLRE